MFDKGTTILIVEDHPSVRQGVKNLLRHLEYEQVYEVDNGEKAWRMMVSSFNLPGVKPTYDLILCDWVMPVMTGVELLMKIRADKRFKDTPFVMLTGQTKQEDVLKAIALGADGYIVKPVTEKDLASGLKIAYRQCVKRQAQVA